MIELAKRKHSKTITYAFLVVLWLLCAATYLVVLLPTQQELARLENEIESEERIRAVLERALEASSQLEQDQQELIQSIEVYRGILPSHNDLPLLVESIDRLMSLSGLKIEGLEYQSLQTDSTGSFFPFELNAEGTFARITGFTQTLLDVFPSIAIKDLTIDTITETEAKLAVNMNLYAIEESNWERPILQDQVEMEMGNPFGYPFWRIRQFIVDELKVLGVVRANDQSYALLAYNGNRNWYRVGERVQEARITEITTRGVSLDYGGVVIQLDIGGMADEN